MARPIAAPETNNKAAQLGKTDEYDAENTDEQNPGVSGAVVVKQKCRHLAQLALARRLKKTGSLQRCYGWRQNCRWRQQVDGYTYGPALGNCAGPQRLQFVSRQGAHCG